MIEENHFHRYQSADEILAELNRYQLSQNVAQSNAKTPTTLTVLVPDPTPQFQINYLENLSNIINSFWLNFGQLLSANHQNINPSVVNQSHQKSSLPKLKKTAIIITFILLPGIITFAWGRSLLNQNHQQPSESCLNYDEIKMSNCIDQKVSKLYNNKSLF